MGPGLTSYVITAILFPLDDSTMGICSCRKMCTVCECILQPEPEGGSHMPQNRLDGAFAPVTIRIGVKGKSKIVQEESLIAVDPEKTTVLAFGQEARKYIGTHGPADPSVCVFCPLKRNVADFDFAASMFSHFVHAALGAPRFRLFKPSIAVCIPFELTEVEYRAYYEAFLSVGAKKVLITDLPFEQARASLQENYQVIVEICPTVVF